MDKLKIAICDDEHTQRQMLLNLLKKVFAEAYIQADFYDYESAVEIAEHLKAGMYFDFYFLDIEMPSMTGIELGHIIRSEYKYDEAIVFFVSGYTHYHGELFGIHPFDFIHKPFSEWQLEHQVSAAFERIKKYNEAYEFEYDRKTFVIQKKRILYIESKGRYLYITYEKNEEYKELFFKGTAKTEFPKFDPPDFVIPHSSFVVNLHYVHQFKRRELEMENGKLVHISYTRSVEARKVIDYFLKHLK